MARERHEYRCSFCGKAQDQVKRMIAGPNGVYICDECVSLCSEIIAEESASSHEKTSDQGSGWRATTKRADETR